MFQTLSNVQRDETICLQQGIDNRAGDLRVGLRSITFTSGWYNICEGESMSWRISGNTEIDGTIDIEPGLYSFNQLRTRFRRSRAKIVLQLDFVNHLVTLQVPSGWDVHFTDGILSLLGLDDSGWLDSGRYKGDRAANFMVTKTLQVYLDQLNTTGNFVDGMPSTLLAIVGLGRQIFGERITVRYEHPEFKRLQHGTINQLKVTVTDDNGQVVNNNEEQISVVLEFQPAYGRNDEATASVNTNLSDVRCCSRI